VRTLGLIDDDRSKTPTGFYHPLPRTRTMERPSGFPENKSRGIVSQGALRDPGLGYSTPSALAGVAESIAEIIFRSYFTDRRAA
jgi:hypothetical protein